MRIVVTDPSHEKYLQTLDLGGLIFVPPALPTSVFVIIDLARELRSASIQAQNGDVQALKKLGYLTTYLSRKGKSNFKFTDDEHTD